MNAHFDPAFKAQMAEMAASGERSAYRRSRGADPVAIAASLSLGATLLAAFAFMNPHFVRKERREPTIVTMMELPDDPPPATEPPPPQERAPPPTPQIAAPVPVVTLPQAPAIVAPPPVLQPAAPSPKAAPPAPMAAIAKGPENVGDLSAQVVFRKPIRVPLESRRQHEEGIVILSVLLATDGSVADISVATSSGFPRLDKAALDAVQDWRWSPLIRNGNAVMVRGLVRIPFIRERGGPDGHDGRRGHGRGRHGDRDDEPLGDGPGGSDDRV